MATVNGSVGGQTVTFTNASASAAQLANSIITAANVTPVTGSATLTNTFFAVTGTQPGTVTGSAAVTVGVLSGQNTVFSTGSSVASEIVASDNSNSGIVNNNPNGSLIAFTGAGGNALVGGGLINGFQTGVGGFDAVNFGTGNANQPQQLNVLSSLGQDTVNIFGTAGQSTTQTNVITALQSGADNVTLNNGASLTFVNLSTATSTITASSGSTVNTGGTGNTLITDAGSTAEAFNVSTASGNVTLVGSASGGVDTFNFVKLSQTNSSVVDVVGNFNAADSVHLLGYAPGNYAANVVNGSTVLTLSDNTQIIFAGVTDPTQVTSRIS